MWWTYHKENLIKFILQLMLLMLHHIPLYSFSEMYMWNCSVLVLTNSSSRPKLNFLLSFRPLFCYLMFKGAFLSILISWCCSFICQQDKKWKHKNLTFSYCNLFSALPWSQMSLEFEIYLPALRPISEFKSNKKKKTDIKN